MQRAQPPLPSAIRPGADPRLLRISLPIRHIRANLKRASRKQPADKSYSTAPGRRVPRSGLSLQRTEAGPTARLPNSSLS